MSTANAVNAINSVAMTAISFEACMGRCDNNDILPFRGNARASAVSRHRFGYRNGLSLFGSATKILSRAAAGLSNGVRSEGETSIGDKFRAAWSKISHLGGLKVPGVRGAI
ncbi:hypothetical protein [Bradyrhizobium sp. WD16]|uniref:hypothetical protein n=1 Tax=Bradyrhizobium sp. WD16 TaxID=1521768 RepID=UPI0020A5FF06|nr:hypothetical protein [Bradyrhizobium sp. WD16]